MVTWGGGMKLRLRSAPLFRGQGSSSSMKKGRESACAFAVSLVSECGDKHARRPIMFGLCSNQLLP